MIQEYKELLLKDLCARLPYGVICHYNCVTSYDDMVICKANCSGTLKGIVPMSNGNIGFMVGMDKINALQGDIKPYLRPMSSMTKEEEEEYKKLCRRQTVTLPLEMYTRWYDTWKSIDYLNKKMFAYRTIDDKDMFELNLALEAPEGMYEY